ncbi:hypothetical protein U5U50_01335 [Mycoplasma sp. 888]|uniref:hypothetical protein n=1 Tax=Mycoplasma sp. 888 TaxID=3108483 RepID=UPI002D77590B|nr:hypothetical protein [Mycoplasma sp. 888]WRQ26024.1 hypothetical protein U5U50_01335 [Mycoplasma sp. 888]
MNNKTFDGNAIPELIQRVIHRLSFYKDKTPGQTQEALDKLNPVFNHINKVINTFVYWLEEQNIDN